MKFLVDRSQAAGWQTGCAARHTMSSNPASAVRTQAIERCYSGLQLKGACW
jgi:hypothetical protein